MNSKQIEMIKQSALEAGRLLVTAIVSYLLTEGVMTFVVDHIIGVHTDAATKLQITTALTIVLKAIDRALHETGVRTTGLTQF